jgi:phage terminase small subunit
VLNPLLRAIRDSRDTILRLASEFGVSPASCAKVHVTESREVSELASHLANKPTILPFPKAKRAR